MTRRVLLLALPLIVAIAAYAQPPAPPPPEQQILDILHQAEAAWNAGDIPGYMNGYWRSDQLRFASGGDVTRGWQATLDRYLAGYPDRAAMGSLMFSELDVTLLGPEAAVVFGRWRLERKGDRPGGLFTLVFRRFPEGWRIVHDHTSSE